MHLPAFLHKYNIIKPLLTLLNHPVFSIFVSIGLGITIFGHYFDFTVLDPSNTDWIMNRHGDQAQHYLGSMAFRYDTWHFPITRTTYINYPEGVSIIYTDSNPLLAIIAKVMKPVFPFYYQYTGTWYLICFILQSIIGYLIIKSITGNNVFALLSGALFCLMPPMIHRTGHENLMAFWLILWACYIFLNDRLTIYHKSILFFIVIIIASLIHAYLCVMVLFIAITWHTWQFVILFKNKNYYSLLKFLCLNAIFGIGFMLILWSFGYLYNSPKGFGLMGFGSYSMNLVAPFNPFDTKFSSFLSPLLIREGQYEGFQYWGIGVILLLTFTSLTHIKKYSVELKKPLGLFLLSTVVVILLIKNNENSLFEKSLLSLLFLFYSISIYSLYKANEQKFLLLYIPGTICFILALSNIITLGNSILFEYHLNDSDFFSPFFRSIRSSGRLFWVTTHILMLSSLFLLYKISNSKKRSISILIIIITLQMLDLYHQSYVVDSKNKGYHSLLSAQNQELLLMSRHVNFIGGFHEEAADFAVLHHKPINNFYTVHNSGDLTIKKLDKQINDFHANIIDSRDLYLFKLSEIPFNKTVNAIPFDDQYLTYSVKQRDKLGVTSNTLLKKKTDTLTNILNAIKTQTFVILAVKDEATLMLDPQFCKQLDLSFNTHLGTLKYRQSYYALFNNGILISEKIGSDGPSEYNNQFNCMNLYIKSAGSEFGNVATIKIDNFDYSLNSRGINIVTILCNPFNHKAISTMNFDTFETSYK